jgi:hypothetical protein
MADTDAHNDQRKGEDKPDTNPAPVSGKRVSLFRALWIMVGMAIKDRKKQVPSEHDDAGWFW